MDPGYDGGRDCRPRWGAQGRRSPRIALISLDAVAGLALVPAAIGAWRHHWSSVGGRLDLSALALAAPPLVWWANDWNLLGFRY